MAGATANWIKFWDLGKGGQCIATLETEDDCGRCFQFQGNRLVSGSDIGDVNEWDWRTQKLVNSFTAITQGN